MPVSHQVPANRWNRFAAAILAVLLLSLAAPPSSAQVLYGSVVGAVQDATGAVIPGATVALQNRGTGQSTDTSTSGAGAFSFTNVLAGMYNLSVTANGFKTYTQENVEVTVNTVRRVEIVLEVGQLAESVTVEAAALSLQTDKSDVNVVLTEQAVRNLPLPRYRNYQSLINLVPGATPGRFQNSIQAAPARALSTNVNGVNRNNNATRIDGALSVYIWLPHHSAYVPPAETIETVNISTNNFDAEQGMAGGAAITVQTKSGTNEFHGSLFALHDNQRLRAKNFFSPGAKPLNITNINGFTAGGPIKRNKLFYFGGWEGNRERLGFNRLMTIPTADQREGNFSAFSNATIYDPLTGNPNGSGRTAFENKTVPLARQSSISRKMQALIPAVNRSGATANYFNAASQKLNRDNFDVKVNLSANDTLSIWGKYSIMDAQVGCEAGLGEAGGPPLCQGNPGVGDFVTQVATVGFTKTLSPTLVWDGLIGWNRMGVVITGYRYGENFGSEFLGIPGTNGPDIRQSGAPMFVVSNYDPIGSDTGTRPALWNDTTYTIGTNFGWIKGAHNLRFGFEGARHHLNHFQPELGGGTQGRFNFTPGVTGQPGATLTQFNSYAAFLMGLPESMQKSLQYEKMTAFNPQAAWYVRDLWQITPRLTFTLGLRYELYPMMTRSGRGGIEGWDPETNLVSLGGNGGNPKDLDIGTSKKLFAPRVGLAYRLGQKTVIRSGYGITYNPMPLARPLRGFYPLTIAFDFNSPNSFQPFAPLSQGIPPIVGPDPSVAQVPLPETALMRFITGDFLERGYVQSWNFIVERELPGHFIGSVGYVGTQTVRSFADWNGNAAGIGQGNAGRPFASKFNRRVDTLYWNGFLSANYHSLQMSVNRRAADGLFIKGAYTYSKAINETDDDGWTGLMFNHPSVLDRNRAAAGFDQNHIFQLGYVYELPFGRGKKYANSGLARWLLGDWQINGTSALYQGRRFGVSASGAALNAPGNSQTADQLKPVVEKIGEIGRGKPFYDPTAFGPVNQARFGTSGRNILRAPGTVNFDLGVFRKFPITERYVLEFRAESFNFTNTPHFGQPSSSVNASNFMEVTSADQDQRQFRFGLRLQW